MASLAKPLRVTLMAKVDLAFAHGIPLFGELAPTGHEQQPERVPITVGLVAGHAGDCVVRGRPLP